MDLTCPVCTKEIHLGDVFCPHCGARLPEKNVPLTLWQKIKIFLVTVLLAPFGLYWFFKLRKSEDPVRKKIAYVVLYLTIVVLLASVVLAYYTTKAYMNYLNSYVSGSSLYGY